MSAVADGGVIDRAENAKNEQLYAVAKEKIQSQCEYTLDGKVDLNKTLSNIQKMNLEEIDYDNITLESNVLTIPFKDGKKVEIDGTSDDGVRDKYSFKLRDLINLAPVNNTMKFYIEKEKLWNLIGEDLSQNEEYYTVNGDSKFFKIISDDKRFLTSDNEDAPTTEEEMFYLLEDLVKNEESIFLFEEAYTYKDQERFYIKLMAIVEGKYTAFFDTEAEIPDQTMSLGGKTLTITVRYMNIINFINQFGDLELKFAKVD